ncbi:hypothetical protein [Acidilobus sp. 7A]|uniref:hypothetical protein n=1 Tax=Acidilobus sp. 7A TaxID=1577685 RepID=UPI0011E4CBF1|nr:hypothetical protein [Acidilobus sp. 7A]
MIPAPPYSMTLNSAGSGLTPGLRPRSSRSLLSLIALARAPPVTTRLTPPSSRPLRSTASRTPSVIRAQSLSPGLPKDRGTPASARRSGA